MAVKTLLAMPESTADADTTLDEWEDGTCTLQFEWQDAMPLVLRFEGVLSFRCTYEEACSLAQIQQSRDRLVDVGVTSWLKEVEEAVEDPGSLQHLMISMEDGPCYEFICRGWSHTRALMASNGD